jgi:hypothetical protein
MFTLQTSFKPFAQVGEGVKSVVEMTVNSEEELAWEVLLPPPRPVEEDQKTNSKSSLRILSLVSLAIKVTVSRNGFGF